MGNDLGHLFRSAFDKMFAGYKWILIIVWLPKDNGPIRSSDEVADTQFIRFSIGVQV